MEYYVCFITNCGESFNTQSEIKFHLRKVHACASIGHYECCVPLCFKTFSLFKHFSEHLRKHKITNDTVAVTSSTENVTDNLFENMELSPYVPESEIDRCERGCETSSSVKQTDLCNIINSSHQYERILSLQETNFEGNVIFTSKYLSKNNITRSDVHNLQNDIHRFITSHIGNMVKTTVLEKMKTDSTSNKEIIAALEEILEICQNPFQNINSEYKYFKFMESNDLFRKPVDFRFNEIIAPKIVKYQNTLSETSSHVSIQDLQFQIRKFFELPGMLDETLQNMEDLNKSGDINNFINGSLFKKIKSTYASDDLVIPFFLYWDDFEINNPLGLIK